MKKYYSVSFKYSENTYCTNIAHAETTDDIKAHYSKYEWVNVEECGQHEVETAKKKGMPIIEIESKQEDESTTEITEIKKEVTQDSETIKGGTIMYDYREAVKNDVLEYVRNEINLEEFDTLDELEEKLNEELWTADSVTGNASGSYTCNRVQAKAYVIDGMDELEEAARELCIEPETIGEKFLESDWEYFDVTIRCYLLGECIAAALEEIEGEFNEAHEDKEEV